MNYKNDAPTTIEEYSIQTFSICHQYVSEQLFKDNTANACKLYDILCNEEEGKHNCFGCNFADYTKGLKRYLDRFEKLDSLEHDIPMYLLQLYLIVERIERVLTILKYPEEERAKNFKSLILIRKWANFIKHPKSFVLTHHPLFNFEESHFPYKATPSVTINSDFVCKYYKGAKGKTQEDLNEELHEILKNKKDVLVLFPEATLLTQNFCDEFNYFIDMILNNKEYISRLNDAATLHDYFSKEEVD